MENYICDKLIALYQIHFSGKDQINIKRIFGYVL